MSSWGQIRKILLSAKKCPASGKKLRTNRLRVKILVEHVPDPRDCPRLHKKPLRDNKDMSSKTRLNEHDDPRPAHFQFPRVAKSTKSRPHYILLSRRYASKKNSFQLLEQYKLQCAEIRRTNAIYLTDSLRSSCTQSYVYSILDSDATLLVILISFDQSHRIRCGRMPDPRKVTQQPLHLEDKILPHLLLAHYAIASG